MMDQLPDLQSDAEVDALMARLRAKIAPAPFAAPDQLPTAAASDDPLRDLLAAQESFASSVVRAMQVMVETLEEFEADAQDTSQSAATLRATRHSDGKTIAVTPRKRPRGKKR